MFRLFNTSTQSIVCILSNFRCFVKLCSLHAFNLVPHPPSVSYTDLIHTVNFLVTRLVRNAPWNCNLVLGSNPRAPLIHRLLRAPLIHTINCLVTRFVRNVPWNCNLVLGSNPRPPLIHRLLRATLIHRLVKV